MLMKFKALVLALLVSTSIYGQNVISLTYAGNDHQIGVRYDKQFNRYGFYSGAGYGVYNDPTIGSIQHTRASGGITRYVQNYAMESWLTYFSFGVSVHDYKKVQDGYIEVPQNALFPVSCELGVGFVISRHLSIGWTFDFIKDDVLLNIGYRFGFK